jgi:hypothetical protein
LVEKVDVSLWVDKLDHGRDAIGTAFASLVGIGVWRHLIAKRECGQVRWTIIDHTAWGVSKPSIAGEDADRFTGYDLTFHGDENAVR